VELPQERARLQRGGPKLPRPPAYRALLLAAGPAGAVIREQDRAEEDAARAAFADQAARRLEGTSRAFATFRSPDSFALFLVLLLPALAAAAWLRWKQGPSGATWLTAGCLVLAAGALWTALPRPAALLGGHDGDSRLAVWSATGAMIR